MQRRDLAAIDRSTFTNPYVLGGAAVAFALLARWWWGESEERATERVVDESSDPIVPNVQQSFSYLTTTNFTPSLAKAFIASLPTLGQQYGQFMVDAGREFGVSPFLLAGIMEQETGYGACVGGRGSGPSCIGFNGQDRGLMQINDGYFPEFFAAVTADGTPYWADPKQNVRQGAKILASNMDYWRGKGGTDASDPRPLTDARKIAWYALASYNAGAGAVLKWVKRGQSPDRATYDRKYGETVLQRAKRIATATSIKAGGTGNV